MTRLIFFLIFLAFPFKSFSQNPKDRIIYLDSNYVKVDKDQHVYCRIVRDYFESKSNYIVEEYYKSGHLKMGAVSTRNLNLNFVGVVVHFFENDTIKSKTLYKDGIPSGSSFSWYQNGKKEMEGEYVADQFSKTKGQVLKIYEYWDENGIHKVTDGNGIHQEKSANFVISGEIKNGLRNGIWNGTDKKYKLSFSDTYENGKFISGLSKDDELVERNYTQINEFPLPKKGIEHFYNFVGRKFNSGRNTLRGNILIGFIIDKNGAIDEVKVLRGMSPKLDREAIRVVNLYADWLPGKYRGKLIDISYSLPISVVQM